jgi:hypothetical protein
MPEAVGPIISNLLVDDDDDVRIFAVNVLKSLRASLKIHQLRELFGEKQTR